MTYEVGDRVRFDNGLGFEPRWFTGTVREVKQGTARGYRVTWDDGYQDDPTAPLYMGFELHPLDSGPVSEKEES